MKVIGLWHILQPNKNGQLIIINLSIMDQHFLLTNLNASLLQLNQSDTRPTHERQLADLNTLDKVNKPTNHHELMTALLQICKIFDDELTYELSKNRLLLHQITSAYFRQATQKVTVKSQEVEDRCVKAEEMGEERICEEAKEKKLAVNDTKNISKNFGKAVITFIQKNPDKIRRILQNHKIDLTVFSNQLKQRKKNLISIKQLRSLWLDSEFQYAKPFRQISFLFLRRASFKYIFGSRIADYAGHLKYRRRMIEALQVPEQFTSIKQ